MASIQSSITQEAAHHLRFVSVETRSGRYANGNSTNTRQRLEEELSSAPLFSALARLTIEGQGCEEEHHQTAMNGHHRVSPQYGLLGLRIQDDPRIPDHHQLVYSNVSAPWSAFICGSQGSGKSHTMSCLLENALIASSPVGKVSSPLAGMVMHYDKFTAFSGTQLCEAAYLCSSNIPVRILVSPTNYHAMKKAYEILPGLGESRLLEIVPMYLSQKHLTVTMMKTLMGIGVGKEQPLYVEV